MLAVDSTGVMALPTWAAVVLIAFLVLGSVLVFLRRGLDPRGDALLPIGLVLVAIVLGSLAFDHLGREPAGQRRAFDMRVLELTAQAMMPGSALACLDAIAGETVETSCEKALFASPEATAAAVSYVAAQLSLLDIGSDRAGSQGSEPTLASLRRALEADRFGIVAHVLATRDGCTADRCKALELLRNPERVSANLAEATYDSNVMRHMAAWPSTPGRPVAAADAPPAAAQPPEPAPMASTKPPSNLFFPSAASIPPVNIMTAEPSGPPQPQEAAGSAEAKPAPARRPQQPRQPAAPTARPGVPMQLGPAGQ